MSLEGRFWVMILPTLGEPGPLEVGEANLEDGVGAGSFSGSEISGPLANSLVGEKLPVASESEIGSEIYSVVYT